MSFHQEDRGNYLKRCLKCGKKMMDFKIQLRKEKTYNKMVKRIGSFNGVCNTTLEEFKKQNSQKYRVSVLCKKHNYTWTIEKSNFDQGKWCRLCGHDKARKKQKENYKKGKLSGLIPNSKYHPIVKPRIWTDEKIIETAKKYTHLCDFIKKDPSVYGYSRIYKVDISFLKRKIGKQSY